jgi:lipopolysaccharide/colanic/teichoic acid biosynthesis glycosyltransferase
MRRKHSRSRRWGQILLDLAVCMAAFLIPALLLGLTDWDRLGLAVAMAVLFWLGAQAQGLFLAGSPQSERSAWVVAIERTWVGAGLNLLLLAGLAYATAVEPTAFTLVIAGSLLAGILGGFATARMSRTESGPVLLVGGAPLGPMMAGDLHQAVIAVGDFSGLAGAVAAQRPARIVVSFPDAAARTMPDELLEYRAAGIEVEHMADLYERLYLRVCTEGLPPADLLSATAFSASRPIMALQATYSNLLGLTLLVVLFPVIALLSLVSGLAAGTGPFFERVECAGFQAIPFYRLRFRTRHAIRGRVTWVGKIIGWLGLTGLPQVINIVRGEMAMFGPAPVRKQFADALVKRIPLYNRRFSTRPGLLGWAQVHMPRGVPEAAIQLEYDLYYLKECSPSLDFEILLRALLRTRRKR